MAPSRAAYLRSWNLRRYYGLSQEGWERLFEGQGRCCAICGTNNPRTKSGRNPWHMDHDHVTGENRGILCFRCNVMLGNSGDDISVLAAAIHYLKAHGG